MRRIKEVLKVKNYNIVTYVWKNDDLRNKGTIQIFHGMAEHILRYEPFIEKLTDEGYVVVGHDHVAHGESTKKENIGVLKNVDFMDEVLKLCKAVRDRYCALFEKGTSYLFSHNISCVHVSIFMHIHFNQLFLLVVSKDASFC